MGTVAWINPAIDAPVKGIAQCVSKIGKIVPVRAMLQINLPTHLGLAKQK
jgi:hypothetical protein